MAFNYFIGRSRAWLEATRTALQDALITGQPTRVEIAGVKSEYDPGKQDLQLLLERVQYAISELEDADSTDPKDQSPYSQKVMSVRTHYST